MDAPYRWTQGKIPLQAARAKHGEAFSYSIFPNLVQLEDCQKFSPPYPGCGPNLRNILMTRKMLMVKWYMKSQDTKLFMKGVADFF